MMALLLQHLLEQTMEAFIDFTAAEFSPNTAGSFYSFVVIEQMNSAVTGFVEALDMTPLFSPPDSVESIRWRNVWLTERAIFLHLHWVNQRLASWIPLCIDFIFCEQMDGQSRSYWILWSCFVLKPDICSFCAGAYFISVNKWHKLSLLSLHWALYIVYCLYFLYLYEFYNTLSII